MTIKCDPVKRPALPQRVVSVRSENRGRGHEGEGVTVSGIEGIRGAHARRRRQRFGDVGQPRHLVEVLESACAATPDPTFVIAVGIAAPAVAYPPGAARVASRGMRRFRHGTHRRCIEGTAAMEAPSFRRSTERGPP